MLQESGMITLRSSYPGFLVGRLPVNCVRDHGEPGSLALRLVVCKPLFMQFQLLAFYANSQMHGSNGLVQMRRHCKSAYKQQAVRRASCFTWTIILSTS